MTVSAVSLMNFLICFNLKDVSEQLEKSGVKGELKS